MLHPLWKCRRAAALAAVGRLAVALAADCRIVSRLAFVGALAAVGRLAAVGFPLYALVASFGMVTLSANFTSLLVPPGGMRLLPLAIVVMGFFAAFMGAIFLREV